MIFLFSFFAFFFTIIRSLRFVDAWMSLKPRSPASRDSVDLILSVNDASFPRYRNTGGAFLRYGMPEENFQ